MFLVLGPFDYFLLPVLPAADAADQQQHEAKTGAEGIKERLTDSI